MEVKAVKFPSMADFFGTATPFGRLLAVSLLLHALAAVPFLSAGHNRFGGAAVAYLDLNMEMARQPAPATNPARPAVAEKAVTPVPTPAALPLLQYRRWTSCRRMPKKRWMAPPRNRRQCRKRLSG